MINGAIACNATASDEKLDYLDFLFSKLEWHSELAKLRHMRAIPNRADLDETVIVDFLDNYDALCTEAAQFAPEDLNLKESNIE